MRYPFVMLVVALMLLPIGCGSAEPPRPTPAATSAHATVGPMTFDSQLSAAASAITLFHVRLDQRNYRGVYAMTDETFRAATSEAELTAMLTALRERVGRSTSVDELSYEFVDSPPDVQITYVVEATFESGTLIETFVWRVTRDETVYLVSFRTR